MYMVRTTHHGWFFFFLVPQYLSTVVLGTNKSSRLVLHFLLALAHSYCSTGYRQLIRACSSFVQQASTLVLQYVVQTTHRGFFFICLACYYVSTEVLAENSSRLVSALVCQSRSIRHGKLIAACFSFVQRVSTLVTQYSIQTLTMTCLFAQYVSAVVLDTENSSRLVVHLFSALGRQYCSTWYRQLITGCSTFLFSGLVRQYCCTQCEKLITACSTFVQCPCTLASQYSVQTLTTASLFAQYVSTVVLGTDSSSLLVLNLSSVLVN